MLTVTSKDSITIAYDQAGQGRAIILVVDALSSRTTAGAVDPPRWLSSQVPVTNYDRRGRGDSGNTTPTALVVRSRTLPP